MNKPIKLVLNIVIELLVINLNKLWNQAGSPTFRIQNTKFCTSVYTNKSIWFKILHKFCHLAIRAAIRVLRDSIFSLNQELLSGARYSLCS